MSKPNPYIAHIKLTKLLFVANSQGRRHPLPARVRTRGPPSPLISFTNSEFSSTSFSLSRLCTLACVGNDSGRSGRQKRTILSYGLMRHPGCCDFVVLLLFFLSFLSVCPESSLNYWTSYREKERNKRKRGYQPEIQKTKEKNLKSHGREVIFYSSSLCLDYPFS